MSNLFLSCQNETNIIDRFIEHFDVPRDEAQDLLNETKKWLWLCAQLKQTKQSLFIDKPILIIDKMWHNFILHTQEYHEFCMRNFNFFIHHRPTTVAEKDAFISERLSDPKKVEEKINKNIEVQYSSIHDLLGRETLVKWYHVYPNKYTPEYIEKIRIKPI